jgi:Flp pilus assembly protein TadG
MQMQLYLKPSKNKQIGAAAVEFALIALIFFTILFAILEFGRMMYLYNTMQEVTRRGARAAVVRWIDQTNTIKSIAFFGGTAIPAGAEVTSANMTIDYFNQTGAAASPLPTDAGDNLAACGDAARVSSCIYSVRVKITGVSYSPMVSLFSFLGVNLPEASVTMHAESLGFEAF